MLIISIFIGTELTAMKTLGQKFKILRQRHGYNQHYIAKILDISVPAYSKIETGLTDPNFSRIIEMAKIYDMDIRQFLNVGEADDIIAREVESLRLKIIDLESNIMRLQKKLIEVYEREDELLKKDKSK